MSYISAFVKVFLFSVGILPEKLQRYNSYLFGILLSVHIILTLGEINAFVHIRESIYKVEIVYQSLCFIYICITQCCSWHQKNFLVGICNRLTGQFPNAVGENAVQEADNTFGKLMKIVAAVYVISIITYICAPMLNFFVTNMDYNDPISYPLPHWYAVWKINSVGEYFTMSVLQNCFCTFVFFVYACSFLFIICVTITCKAHIKEIHSRVAKLSSREMFVVPELEKAQSEKQQVLLKCWTVEEETMLIRELIDIIKYNQVVFRLVQDIASYLQWIFTAAIAWFLAVAVLTLFMTTQIVSDIVFKIKILSVVSNVMFSFFLFCYVSENISHLNESILEALYGIPWYTQFVRLRKIIITSQIRCHRPIEIKAFGMYTMNLKMFGSVLRLIYSCLNVLLLMKP